MRILWKYLKPHKGLIIVSLALALAAQLLSLIDPLIFGKIIDDYASGRGSRPENELVRGVVFWLALAIAIVGPSGSGKSTQVKLLVGLYRPVSGSIYFNKASSTNIRYNPLRRQIGERSKPPSRKSEPAPLS